MKLNQHHIIAITIHDTTTRHILYDDQPFQKAIDTYLFEMEPEIHEQWLKNPLIVTAIPFEQWTIDELVTISGDLLEDVNKHNRTDEPLWLKTLLTQAKVPEENQLLFFQQYIKDLFDEYGY